MSVAAVETETAPATGDPAPAPADETETPGEVVEPAPAEGEQPAEGAENPDIEPAPELPAAAAEVDEETLRSAAFKFANKTMAAVRRAEKRVETVKTENTTLKGHLQTYAGFVERLQKGDPAALREVGFNTVREYLTAVQNFGEPAANTVETRMEALERQLREREEATARSTHEQTVAESQRLVFAHVDGDKTRWRYTSSEVGHEQLWDSLGEYYRIHGDVPDAAVPLIADAIEKHLRSQFGDGNDSGQRQPAKTGASPSQLAAGGGRNSGKTLTNRGSSGAPAPKRYSDDSDERTRQIMEEMRVEGLLSGPPR